jgi:hypothetical protein
MRTTPLDLFYDAATDFDMMVRKSFESILGMALDAPSWEQAKLSLNTSGIGLRPCTAHAHGAFIASVDRSNPLIISHAENGIKHYYDSASINLKSIHPNIALINNPNQRAYSKVIDENTFLKIYEVASPSSKARLDAIRRPHANAWLSAPPCQMLNLELSNIEFQTGIFRWLGAPIPQAASSLCAACQSTLTPKAGHTIRCRHRGDIASRHNRIRDIVFSLASNAHMEPVKEKPHIFLDKPGQRPADVYIPQFLEAKLQL